jgi:NodT family efflux transporter outer membrane factor (OMF) lipoprotein
MKSCSDEASLMSYVRELNMADKSRPGSTIAGASASSRTTYFLAAWTALAALFVLMSACAPKDIKPQITLRTGQTLGLGGALQSAPAEAWWRAFGDPQLDRIMVDTVAGNPSLEAALARLRAAQAAVGVERAGLLPQVDVTAQESYGRLSAHQLIPPPYGGSDRWIGAAQTNLTWTLDFAGRQRALVSQARHSAESADLDAAAARLALTSAVAQTYVALTRAERQVEIARDYVTTRRRSLGLAQSRANSGLASDFDLRVAETLVAEAEQAQTRAEGDRDLIVHSLAALAGRGADYYDGVKSSRVDLAAALPIPTALPANLLTRRPDLMAADARVEAARAGTRVARADFFPTVDLRAFVGVSALGLSSLFTSGAVASGVGPAISAPIFHGGRLRSQYKQAVADLDTATAQYDAQAVAAIQEAADALSNVDTSTAEAAHQQQILAGYTETARLERARRRSGLGAETDVLASNERVLQAELTQAQLDAEATARRIQLLVAVGGDFRKPSPSAFAASGQP